MGTQRALGRRARSPAELDAILVGLVDRLSRRLRTAERVCRTVVLRLRFADFARATRSHTLGEPTDETRVILAAERELLGAAMPLIQARGITLLGITVTNLTNAGEAQLALGLDRRRALDAALDDVRNRFGSAAITRAVLLGRDQGITMPLLPD